MPGSAGWHGIRSNTAGIGASTSKPGTRASRAPNSAWQTNAQNFGQDLSAAQLREQVNQVASQQGWSQAQAEAAFREQMAHRQARAGLATGAPQGQQWTQGQAQQWDQEQVTSA